MSNKSPFIQMKHKRGRQNILYNDSAWQNRFATVTNKSLILTRHTLFQLGTFTTPATNSKACIGGEERSQTSPVAHCPAGLKNKLPVHLKQLGSQLHKEDQESLQRVFDSQRARSRLFYHASLTLMLSLPLHPLVFQD